MPPVISVENLSKTYRLGQIGTGTFTNDLKLWWAKARGKPNPLLRIGETDHGNRDGEELWALKDISFTVEQGEVLGIIGRNGAGKSTLLKILSRVTAPTSGRIRVKGRVASLLEVGTGFHPELTGRENIYLNGAILGMTRQEVTRKFDEIVAFAEVEKFIDTPVKRYSSGMYVRLAFAVAAHLEPEILVVDEVLAVGDAEFQKKCLGKMGDVAQQGRTVLFVSHNMGSIHTLCPTSILLDRGQIVDSGLTAKVIRAYISRGMAEKPMYAQSHDSEKPVNLRKAWLANNSGEISYEFRYDQGFRVVIEYEVNQPIKNCKVWIGVRSVEEIWAFGSADTDSNISTLNHRVPGYYRTTLNIPGFWLNAGQYYIVVGISRLRLTYDRVEVSAFRILDIGVPQLNRPGIFQPILKWDTDSLSQ